MALDTLKFARKLQEAGMPTKQAEAQAEAIQEALEGAAVTKADFANHRADLRSEFAGLRARFTLAYWMAGLNIALTASILVKLLIVR